MATAKKQPTAAPRPKNRTSATTAKINQLVLVAKAARAARKKHVALTPPNTRAKRPAYGGVRSRVAPYDGPKEFELREHTDSKFPFVVRRNELKYAPTGSFDVEYRGVRLGCQLSYPEVDDCVRLRKAKRAHVAAHGHVSITELEALDVLGNEA